MLRREVQQHRLRGHVIVPDVVVGGLEAPLLAARGDLESHHCGRIDFRLTRTMGTPVVRRGVPRRQVDEAEFGVDRRRRPDVRGAAGVGLALGRQLGDRVVADVPGPGDLAGPDVEGAHRAGRFLEFLVVHHPAAEDNLVAGHGGLRGGHVEVGLHRTEADLQVDDAVLAEAGAALAGGGVEREQTRVGGRGQDASGAERLGGRRFARLRNRRRRRFPVADAAAAVPEARLHLRVVAPPLLAGVGVDGDHHIGRRAEVEGVADLLRRVLVLRAAVGRLAGAEGPGDLQLADVAAGDLVERCEALAAGVAAVIAPVGVGARGQGAALGLHGRFRLALGEGRRDGRAQHAQRRDDGDRDRDQRLQPARRLGGRGQHGQYEEAQHRGRDQARDQRPEGQARFPHRPDDRDAEYGGVDEAGLGSSAGQQGAGAQHTRAGQQVVGRTLQVDQPGAAGGDHQAHERHEAAADRRPDAARQPAALHVRHLRILRARGVHTARWRRVEGQAGRRRPPAR